MIQNPHNKIRVHCNPFPEIDSKATLGLRSCLSQLAAGRSYCLKCKGGARLKKEWPGLFAEIKREAKLLNWGATGCRPPDYQKIQRQKMAASVGEGRERARGAR